MSLEDYKGVFIYAQQVDNKLSNIAFELLGKARELAADLDEKRVTAVLLGSEVGGLGYTHAGSDIAYAHQLCICAHQERFRKS